MISQKATWSTIAEAEIKARQAVLNVRQLNRRQRADPHNALGERLQQLFNFFGLAPNAAGYRKLLLVILSECDVCVRSAGDQPVQRISGLVRPTDQNVSRRPKRISAADAVPLATQLADPSFCWSGLPGDTPVRLSKAQAITRAADILNDAAVVDEMLRLELAPRGRVTPDSVKKAWQRASTSEPTADPPQAEAHGPSPVDPFEWQAALEAAAPRADLWVDRIQLAIDAWRDGLLPADACAEIARAAVYEHLGTQTDGRKRGQAQTFNP